MISCILFTLGLLLSTHVPNCNQTRQRIQRHQLSTLQIFHHTDTRTVPRRSSSRDKLGSLNFFTHLLPLECAYVDSTLMKLPPCMSETRPSNLSSQLQRNCSARVDIPPTFEHWGEASNASANESSSSEASVHEGSEIPRELVPHWTSVLTQLLNNAQCLCVHPSLYLRKKNFPG